MNTPGCSSNRGLPGGDGVSGGVERGDASESDPCGAGNGSSMKIAEVRGSMSLRIALYRKYYLVYKVIAVYSAKVIK